MRQNFAHYCKSTNCYLFFINLPFGFISKNLIYLTIGKLFKRILRFNLLKFQEYIYLKRLEHVYIWMFQFRHASFLRTKTIQIYKHLIIKIPLGKFSSLAFSSWESGCKCDIIILDSCLKQSVCDESNILDHKQNIISQYHRAIILADCKKQLFSRSRIAFTF